MLGNSSRSLIPIQKRQLYRCCVLPIVLYSFQLWYYNKAPLTYPLKELRKIQRRVVLWISGAFFTSSTLDIKAIASLISIHLHFQKLSSRSQLRVHSLPSNYIIKALLETRSLNDNKTHWLLLENLMPRQYTTIKGHIVDMDNRFNKLFSSFSSFYHEFSPGNWLIDIFPNQFLFHSLNRKDNDNIKSYLYKLDSIILQALSDLYLAVIILNTSIKNQVATLISHIHLHNSPVIKTIHHAVNVSFTKAELFTIRYGINQATCLSNINCIFVITNSIHTTKRIFDSSLYLYQIHSVTISCKLREFFQKIATIPSNFGIVLASVMSDMWSLDAIFLFNSLFFSLNLGLEGQDHSVTHQSQHSHSNGHKS